MQCTAAGNEGNVAPSVQLTCTCVDPPSAPSNRKELPSADRINTFIFLGKSSRPTMPKWTCAGEHSSGAMMVQVTAAEDEGDPSTGMLI